VLYKVADSHESPTDTEEVEAMVARARSGDREVLPRLKQFLDDHPEVWRRGGDLARQSMEMWINLIAGSDLIVGESLCRKVAALSTELAGPASTVLERLLVERVAACWLQVHYADATVAQAVDVSLKQAAYVQRRQDAAHRRYLSAIGALAMVRRLGPGRDLAGVRVATGTDGRRHGRPRAGSVDGGGGERRRGRPGRSLTTADFRSLPRRIGRRRRGQASESESAEGHVGLLKS
jgi:hypothetical protein